MKSIANLENSFELLFPFCVFLYKVSCKELSLANSNMSEARGVFFLYFFVLSEIVMKTLVHIAAII